jgi:hypothetical protein
MAVAVTLGYAGKILSESSRDKFKSLASYALAIGLVFVLFQFVHMGLAPSLLWGAFQTLYQNDPTALAAKFSQICAATNDSTVCAAAADPIGFANQSPNNQYDQKLCALSIYSDWKYLQSGSAPSWESISASLRCSKLSDYWIDSMEWINSNLEPDARIISWWDYGHWINYFGQRNAVIRNEHLSNEMIGAVADGYLDSTPEELKSLMESYSSKYALFDIELVIGGNSLGGKYSALNYLSCAYNNETTVLDTPGWSACEAEHLWEAVLISSVPCTISNLTGKTGITAYHISVGGNIVPYYPSDCIGTTDTSLIQTCKAAYKMIPTYCIGETTLATGETYPAAYYLNETYPNGDLKLNKAYFGMTSQLGQTVHLGQVTEAILFYTKDALWLDNGVITSGYEDRKGKFYDSALYQAIFLNYLPGFELVYSSSDNAVKIFKIADAS